MANSIKTYNEEQGFSCVFFIVKKLPIIANDLLPINYKITIHSSMETALVKKNDQISFSLHRHGNNSMQIFKH